MAGRVLVRWCLSSLATSTIAFATFTGCTGGSDFVLGGGSDDASGGRDSRTIEFDASPPPFDAAKKDVTTLPPEEDAATCKTPGATFTPPVIKSPAPKVAAACTDSQISAIATACAKEPESAGCTTARIAAANKSCGDCLFGQKTDTLWKMIVLDPGATPPARYNQAGCIELASGVKDCGKKYYTVIACFDAYCFDCAGADETMCQKDVAQGSGECKQYLIDQACGNALDATETTCMPAGQTDTDIKNLFTKMAAVFCK